MAGTEYPKIDTLYDRDERHLVIAGKLRRPEFGNIKRWSITEKLHGRNTRISLINNGIDGVIDYGGKTDEADMPPDLIEYLRKTFPIEKMKSALWLPNKPLPKIATIYGEAYGTGTGMVHGSGLYRKDISFRLFDCLIDIYWLERGNLEDVARKLGIKCVPLLGVIDFLPTNVQEIEYLLERNKQNLVATEEGGSISVRSEGIVAKCEPMVFYREGEKLKRMMWKLKIKDFPKKEPIKFRWTRQITENKTEWKLVRRDNENEIMGSVIVTKGSLIIGTGTKNETNMWKVVAECDNIGYKEIQENDEKTIKLMAAHMISFIREEIEKLSMIEELVDSRAKCFKTGV